MFEEEKKIYFPITIDEEKADHQNMIKINNIPVYFPYEPYEAQKNYMEKVISTLNNKGSISALESPTGTGKTLCLLCAVLAWVKENNKDISIYYCTRTVSQINNVLKELNKTCYKLNVSFVASRKHTCINFTKSQRNKMDCSLLNDFCENIRGKNNKNKIKNRKQKEEEEEEKEEETEEEKEEEKEKEKEESESDSESKIIYYEKDKEKDIKGNKEIQNLLTFKKLDSCIYYRKKKYNQNDSIIQYKKYNHLQDIEDLLKKGKDNIFCPYFFNIHKSKRCANLTIMTYNYMLNPIIRNKLKIVEKNSIVILDEAHNICSILENLDTKIININNLENIQDLLQIFLDFINENKQDIISEDDSSNKIFELNENEINNEITIIKNFIKEIKEYNWDEDKQLEKIKNSENTTYVFEIDYFKKIFQKFNTEIYHDVLTNYKALKNDDKKELIEYGRIKDLDKLVNKIRNFYEFLGKLNNFKISINESNINENTETKRKFKNKQITNENINSFRFILKKIEKKMSFEIICIDASYGFKKYLSINPYSTILTSGTLSIDSLQNLLDEPFYEKLNNDHVLNNEQFKIDIIKGYINDDKINKFSFNYKNRNNIQQIKLLGNEIYNLANSVQIGGILVFFQSYEYLNKCHRKWLEYKIIQKFESIKDVIFDINSNKDFSEELILKTKKNKNLLLFTVYRGKNSEGINFADDEARMVICIGVPYPNLSDPKVIFKKDFLDKRNKIKDSGFTGDIWYKEEAMNAANQSLGRLIRHKDDYGIMICFGIEFYYNIDKLSKWIRKNKNQLWLKDNNKMYYEELNKFLTNLRAKFPPKSQNLENINESIDDIREDDESDYDNEDSYYDY